ncbi:MAG TPA: DUF2207 domain-containing protein, partial [Gemmatimonadaceae bacterium]|nr:DUF2207 domain-containing protein [Gemmatimonadaceae bacterium]
MKKFFLAFAVVVATQLSAQERIRSYDSELQIRRDGTLDVTERITVHAEGSSIRRGIYRDFPTRYTDRLGNRVRVDLEVLGVERNGISEPWFTESMSNGIRINTGNDDFLPVPADYTYTLHYRTTRQLGFFRDHDELYWNAIGAGWSFPIEAGSAEVRLPAAIPVNQMSAEAYTGPQGAKGTDYVAELPAPGVGRYRLTRQLNPYEAFTIVLTFPKGIVAQPTSADRAKWFLRDNRGVLVALAGLALLLLYMLRTWKRVGRDPEKGIIIARYEPRAGQSPAGLRFLKRMGYDMRCFTADVLALAVGGHLRIKQDEGFFKNDWTIERTDSEPQADGSRSQRALFLGLFPGQERTLALRKTNATILSGARQVHQNALDAEFQPQYFKRNGGKVAISVLIAVVTMGIAFVVSGGYSVAFLIGIGAVMVITLAIFGRLIRAPTAEGRALLDEIEGLKLYMSVAERAELASMRAPDAPPLDAKRYEAMLPFAVALDVEDAWTKKFTEAAGAAAAAEAASRMSWYRGRGPITDLGDFSNAVGSSL